MLPPTAFRFDPGAAITVFARYLPQILTGGTDGLKLLGSFKKVAQQGMLCDSRRTSCCCVQMPNSSTGVSPTVDPG